MPPGGPTSQSPQQGQGRDAAGAAAGGEFLEDSDTMSPVVGQEGLNQRMALLCAAAKACEFVASLQSAAGGTPGEGVRGEWSSLLM